MATPSIIKYPLDLLGTAVSNRVSGEEFIVPRGPRARAFALKAGPAFANSVVLTKADTGVPLVRGEDYTVLYLNEEATAATGQAVISVVWFLKDTVFGSILGDYQVVGGPYSGNAASIQLLIETLALDDRAVEWDDILNRPVYYPPAPHLHNVRDWYGFDAIIEALDRLTAVLGAGGGNADLGDIYARLDQIDNDMLQMQQVDMTLGNALTAIGQLVTALENAINQKIEELTLALVHKVPGNLAAGRVNALMVAGDFVLPSTTGKPIGTMVQLKRRQINIVPKIGVFSPGTAQEPDETLRYRSLTGTAFNYITRNDLCAILVEPKVWEITNDDD